MPFLYILYILIKKILKLLYLGLNRERAETSWGRTGKGPKPLAFHGNVGSGCQLISIETVKLASSQHRIGSLRASPFQ